MEQIDDYVLLAAQNTADLNDHVRKKLREGYTPWQAPSVTMDNMGNKIYIQAVAKFKKAPQHLAPPR